MLIVSDQQWIGSKGRPQSLYQLARRTFIEVPETRFIHHISKSSYNLKFGCKIKLEKAIAILQCMQAFLYELSSIVKV